MGRGNRNLRNPGRTRSAHQQRQYRHDQFYRDDYDIYVDELNRRDYDEYHENSEDARVIYNDYPDRNYTQRYNEEHRGGNRNRRGDDSREREDVRGQYGHWAYGVRGAGTTGGTSVDSRGLREDLEEFDDEWNEANYRDYEDYPEDDVVPPRRVMSTQYDNGRYERPRRRTRSRRRKEWLL